MRFALRPSDQTDELIPAPASPIERTYHALDLRLTINCPDSVCQAVEVKHALPAQLACRRQYLAMEAHQAQVAVQARISKSNTLNPKVLRIPEALFNQRPLILETCVGAQCVEKRRDVQGCG
jgi:hypothetical protein